MNRKLLKLIEKNFKIAWKSKLFVLLILLGPLLLTLMLGWAFNNSKDYAIKVGVYSENYDGVKKDILEHLGKNFVLVKFESVNGCVNSVKGYETHICVIMPKEIKLEGDELSEVVFYADNSRVNLVWVVLDSLSNIFSLSSQQLSTGMTSDLLGRLKIAENKSTELQKAMVGVLGQENMSVLLVEDVAKEIALLNLVGAKKRLDESMALKEQTKNLLENDLAEMAGKASESKIILNNISSILGNGSSVSGQISQLSGKLDRIETLAKNGEGINDLNELGRLLDEVKSDFSELEKNVEVIIKKNGEVLVLLKKLQNNLIVAKGLTDEISIAVSNLKVTRVDKIVEPIRTKIEPVAVEKTYLGFIFPTLVLMMVIFVAILLSSSLIVMEKKNRAFFRNWLSRGWGLNFILAYFLTDLAIVLIDVFVFVTIVRFVFGIFINLAFLGLLVLLAGMFVLLGEVIGLAAKNEQGNVLMGVAVSSVLVFFSNTLIPIESASESLQKVIKYNPLVVGERLLRKILMPGMGFNEIQHDLFLVVTYFLILALALILLSVIFYEKRFEWIGKKWKK